jgi:hypothetical protein
MRGFLSNQLALRLLFLYLITLLWLANLPSSCMYVRMYGLKADSCSILFFFPMD